MSSHWKMCWLDLETTGLDERRHVMLEVYARATTEDPKNVIGEFHGVMRVDMDQVRAMDDYARGQHQGSGLLAESLAAVKDVSDIGDELMSFLDGFAGKREAYLAGNSIHFDRKFIRESWPNIDEFLHHRMLDVSSLIISRNAQRGLRPDFGFPPKEARPHRSRGDVEMSIALYEGLVEEAAGVDVVSRVQDLELLAAHDSMFRQLHGSDIDPRESKLTTAVRARLESCTPTVIGDGRVVTVREGRIVEARL